MTDFTCISTEEMKKELEKRGYNVSLTTATVKPGRVNKELFLKQIQTRSVPGNPHPDCKCEELSKRRLAHPGGVQQLICDHCAFVNPRPRPLGL